MEYLALEGGGDDEQAEVLLLDQAPRRGRAKPRTLDIEERARHAPPTSDSVAARPPTSITFRPRARRSSPPAVGVEQIALQATRTAGHGDRHDDDRQRQTRRGEGSKRKDHQSPYNVGGSRAARGNVSSIPKNYSSPLKPSSRLELEGRSRLSEPTPIAPTSEPRPQSFSTRQRAGPSLSSPTTAYHPRQRQVDDLMSRPGPQTTFNHSNPASGESSKSSSRRPSPAAPAAPGPSWQHGSPGAVYVVEDSDDGSDGYGENDGYNENLPLPARHLPDSRSRSNSGPSSHQRTAFPPRAQVGGRLQTSRAGPSASRQDPREANGHQLDRESRRPTRSGAGTRDDPQDESVSDIRDFPSQESQPSVSKGKGKETAPRIGPPLHAQEARKSRPKMQGKDGQVPPDLVPLRTRKKVSNTTHIPSSQLSQVLQLPPPIVEVTSCSLSSPDNKLSVEKLAVHKDEMVLTRCNGRLVINVLSVMTVYLFEKEQDYTFGIEVDLSPTELKNLQGFSGQPYLRVNVLSILLVLKPNQDSRELLLRWLRDQNQMHKFVGTSTTAVNYLLHGPPKTSAEPEDQNQKVTATQPVQPTPRSRAAANAAKAAVARSQGTSGSLKSTSEKGSGKGRASEPAQQNLHQMAARRSSRAKHPPRRLGDDPSLFDDDVISVTRPKDMKKFLFHLHSLDITANERWRFGYDMLNDTCLEFGLRHTLEPMSAEIKNSVHCFNSYFYTKLSEPGLEEVTAGKWLGYDVVQRWTRKTSIFEKKFVIVPVNEQYHWYLAVIYNPAAALLKARDPQTLSQALADDLESRSSRSPEPSNKHARTSGQSSGAVTPATKEASVASGPGDSDRDPCNILDETDGEANEVDDIEGVAARVSDLGLDTAAPPERSPQPIQSLTWNLFTQQSTTGEDGPAGTPSPPPAPVKKTNARRREAYDILGTNEPWIFTFDSLGTGSKHLPVVNHLKKWLEYEARDKLGKDIDCNDIKYIAGHCPQQPNFSDCGLYLIHYVEQLLLHSDAILRFLGDSPQTSSKEWQARRNEVWAADKPSELRNHWLEIVEVETAKYNSLHGIPTPHEEAPSPPPESQLSVQALSQPATRAERTSAPPSALPTVPEVARDLAPHSSAPGSPTERTRLRAPLSLSISPEKESSPVKTASRVLAPGWDDNIESTSPGSSQTPDVEDHRDGSSRLQVELSDSEEEEPVENERYVDDELPFVRERANFPGAMPAIGDEPDSWKEAREMRPLDSLESVSSDVDELDDNDDIDPLAQPVINKQLLTRASVQAPTGVSSSVIASAMDDDMSSVLPGAYPQAQRMDVDYQSDSEEFIVGTSTSRLPFPQAPDQDASQAVKCADYSPNSEVFILQSPPAAPVLASTSRLSSTSFVFDSPPPSPKLGDRYAELRGLMPTSVHASNGGAGKSAAGRSTVARRPAPDRPDSSTVLVPASFPSSRANGRHPASDTAEVDDSVHGDDADDHDEHSEGLRLESLEDAAPVENQNQEPILIDDDSTLDDPPASRRRGHRSSRLHGTPERKWSRNSSPLPADQSPQIRRRTRLSTGRKDNPELGSDDEQASPAKPATTKLGSKPPSSLTKGKGKGRAPPPRGAAGKQESPHVVEDDSDIDADAEPEAELVDFSDGREYIPSGPSKKPRAASSKKTASKAAPISTSPKINGNSRPKRTANSREKEDAQFVPSSGDDTPADGSSRPKRFDRQQSLEAPKPKPARTYGSKGKANKRRKTDDDDSQQSISHFFSTSRSEARGNRKGTPFKLDD